MTAAEWRRVVARVAVVGLTLSMLLASSFGGRAYFFCAAMDRVFDDHPCCAGFERSVVDEARDPVDAPMTLDDDDACCEARHRPLLPNGTVQAAADPIEAPLLGLVPPPPALVAAAAPRFVPHFRAERATGPPPLSAHESAARLSVYLL